MSRNRKSDKKSSGLGLLIFLIVFFSPEAIFVLLPLFVIGYLVFTLVKAVSGKSRRETFDNCPQSIFCRHKDKGEHYVKRGREIDPWDRPDIDISKYQRKE